MRWASLSDYVADVAEVAASLPSSPILVGHSMGGGVVQRYLETRARAPGAVLLASLPPTGVIGATLKIARNHPLRFARANLTLSLYCVVDTPELAKRLSIPLHQHARQGLNCTPRVDTTAILVLSRDNQCFRTMSKPSHTSRQPIPDGRRRGPSDRRPPSTTDP